MGVVITVAAVQATPLPVTGLPVFGQSATLDPFSTDTERVRAQITGPALLAYPELHLFGTDDQWDEHHDQTLKGRVKKGFHPPTTARAPATPTKGPRSGFSVSLSDPVAGLAAAVILVCGRL